MARLHLVAPRPDEDEIHAAVARALDRLLVEPAQWSTFPAGGYELSKAAAARLFRLGLKPSWPDVLIVHQGIFGIELKDHDGRLSTTRIVHSKRTGRPRIVLGQREMHEKLRAAGMQVATCRSVDAVLRQCREWRIPLRAYEFAA